MTVLILVTLVHLPVTMLMWYSPVLVAWHGMAPVKAMFFSLAAFLRNLGAFSLYGLVWAGWMIAASLGIGLLLGVFGLGGAGIYIVMPLLVPLIAALYCSFYASYTGVLVDTDTGVNHRQLNDTQSTEIASSSRQPDILPPSAANDDAMPTLPAPTQEGNNSSGNSNNESNNDSNDSNDRNKPPPH